MKNLSLRKRMVLAISITSVIGLSLMPVMANKIGDVISKGKEASVKAAAQSLMDNIDSSLYHRYQDTAVFAMSDAARSGDPARLIPYLNELVAAYGEVYPAMMVVTRRGKIIAANTHDSAGKPIPSEGLFGRDYSQAAWFAKAIEMSKEGCASEAANGAGCVLVDDARDDEDVAHFFKYSGKVLNFTAPIRATRNGETVGFWTNRVGWEGAVAAIVKDQTKLLQGAGLASLFVSIRDSRGKLLLSPEGWPSTASEEEWKPVTQTTFRMNKVTAPLFSGAVFEASSPSQGHASFPGVGWTTVAQAPTGDSLKAFFRWVQLTGVVLVLLALVFSLWVVRGTIRMFLGMITQLDEQSNSLRSASSQLTNASQDLAQSATEQSSSLQETASSIDEINSMITRSAENAERSIRIAGSSQETATRGKKVVDDMIQAIGEISQSNTVILKQVETGNQQLTEIIKVISEIGNKTKVINDIAFQTKLLSFNASVEAARAGEHGKGFAVVAEEVGSLAAMSGNAAKDIGEMLNGSIQTVQEIVQSSRGRVEKLIEEGKAKIDSGIQVARQCESVLEEIVRAETQMNSIINEIAHASKEQAQGMAEITKAVGQLDQVTNRNASISQQTEGFAEAIARLAKSLKERLGFFRQMLEGGASQRSSVEQNSPVLPKRDDSHQAFGEQIVNLFGSDSSESGANNVIPLRPQQRSESNPFAMGNEADKSKSEQAEDFPSESDPRFKEV